MVNKKQDFVFTHVRVEENEQGAWKYWYLHKDVVAIKRIKSQRDRDREFEWRRKRKASNA